MAIITILAILLNTYVVSCVFKSIKINEILKVSVLFYSLMWVVIPGLGVIFVENHENISGKISTDFIMLYGLEVFLFSTALLTFLFFGKIL